MQTALQKRVLATNITGGSDGLEPFAAKSSASNADASDKPTSIESQLRRHPLPFLIRKSLKLYFVRPPPRESSNKAFFLPPPSMALPNLPGTRRLKAIIPGARIQVQIQIPNIIPIPGYAQTSQLVPCSKTGGLIPAKGAIISPNLSDRYFGYGMKGKVTDGHQRADPRYPDNFQVALTIRKMTQGDIMGNDILRRRYEYAGTLNQTIPASVSSSTPIVLSHPISNSSVQGFPRKRVLSQPQSSLPSSFPSDSHSILMESDDAVTMDETVEQTVITSSNQQRSADGGEGSSASSYSHKKSWRREVRVRKVKCEFWQKESCRLVLFSFTTSIREMYLAHLFPLPSFLRLRLQNPDGGGAFKINQNSPRSSVRLLGQGAGQGQHDYFSGPRRGNGFSFGTKSQHPCSWRCILYSA